MKRACVALRAEGARSAEAQAAATEARAENVALQARVASLSEELAKARAQNDVSNARLAALRTKMSEKEAETWESKETIAGLRNDLERTREAVGRCTNDRERFRYVLALTGQEGSIPRSVLASDPDSHLCKMYGGEWDYARDAEGRALITCHPQRWAAIVEYLATGAVPAERDPALLAQARYWNLQGLVDGLEALVPGVTVTDDADGKGFTARCTFVSLMEKLTAGDAKMEYTFAGPRSRWWTVSVTEKGVGSDPRRPFALATRVEESSRTKEAVWPNSGSSCAMPTTHMSGLCHLVL